MDGKNREAGIIADALEIAYGSVDDPKGVFELPEPSRPEYRNLISSLRAGSPSNDQLDEADKLLADSRLKVKYMQFDLEATRRENGYLRQMLESRHQKHEDEME